MGRNLLGGKVLRRGTAETLWTSQHLREGTATGYGIRRSSRADSAGHRVVGHTGGAMGETSILLICPEQKLVMAPSMNSDLTFIGLLPRIGDRLLATSAP